MDRLLDKEEYQNLSIRTDDEGIYITALGRRINLMERSEETWLPKEIEEICKIVKPKSVLELGFGLGITGKAFQKYGVKRHVIIEAHPVIYKQGIAVMGDNVEMVNSYFQDFESDEGFDLVYDDRYELVYNYPTDYSHLKYKWLCRWTDKNQERYLKSFKSVG